MKYRVVWRRRAKKELAEVWLNAVDRNEVTAAAHRIEILLGRDATTVGESRDVGYRIVFDGPVAVIYKTDAQSKRVVIITVGPPLRAP